jgi:hypothetical protein
MAQGGCEVGAVRAVLAVAALLLLAGCGGEVEGTADRTPAPPLSSATDGDGDAVPELPDLSTIPTPTPTPTPTRTATRAPAGRLFGADASWPQCPKGMGIPQKRSLGAPMPTDAARFVVLGLTNGPSFTPNPCLAAQVSWVAERHLLAGAYAVVSYPDAAALRRYGGRGPFDGSTRLGALANTGYQAGVFSLATMRDAGLRSPVVWVDVEPVPDFDWSADHAANAAVVRGTARAYADAGHRVGYYSTPSLWRRVVGDLRTGGAPEWRAAGQTSLAEALRRCADDWSFGGGRGVLGQWVEDARDRNVTCPGQVANPREWFHRY